MNKTLEEQKLLNWLESEKSKDNLEINSYRNQIVSQFKSLKKEDIFPKKEKISLWKKIKLIILG